MEAAKRIVDLLQSIGHEVLTRHLLREDAWEGDRHLPPQEVFARDMRWLAQCDIFIAEVSGSSTARVTVVHFRHLEHNVPER